ncbi:MAG: ribosome maturation factor RimP [Gammaproteobacteria bacterium]
MRQGAVELRKLLGPVIEAMGYECVGIELHPRPGNALLRVYIDKAGGVNLDDCQQVSYQISGVLDVEDPIRGRYTLEVSSPGLDRPLLEAKHYAQFAGSQVRIHCTEPFQGKRKITGWLRGLAGEDVVIECDGAELRVPLAQIQKARLVPEY